MKLNEIMERFESKLDKVQEDMTEVKITMAQNTSDIAHHIKRSDMTDEQVKLLQDRVVRVETSDNRINWTIRVIIGIAAVATFLREMGLI